MIGVFALTMSAAAEPTDPYKQRVVEDGLAIEFSIAPVDEKAAPGRKLMEGEGVVVRFKITDTKTGEPVKNLYPAAWLDLLPPGQKPDPKQAVNKVEGFLGGSLFRRPEVDLNVFCVPVLNQDATISVVDPLFGFGGSKLLALVQLPGEGHDWAMTSDQEHLFVSIPEALYRGTGQVVAIDTSSWELEKSLDIGFNAGRLGLQPDGKYL